MANNCLYEMKVVGSCESREKFLRLLTDSDLENHFCRVFSAGVDNYDDDATYISGDCAWSIDACMISGYPDQDLLALHTKELQLQVEIWSTECGCCFEEHYVYDNGECLVDECSNYFSFIYDTNIYSSKDEFIDEMVECGIDTARLPDIDNICDGSEYEFHTFDSFVSYQI